MLQKVLEDHYANALQLQIEKFERLQEEHNPSNFIQEEWGQLLNEVHRLFEQFELMNRRFDALEAKAYGNEALIHNLTKELKNSLPAASSHLDFDRLNNKVVQIQDYLEHSTEADNETTSSKTAKKDKSVLTGQINLIDELLENTIAKEVDVKQETKIPKLEKSFVVDYEAVKKKQVHKGFGLFRAKPKKMMVEEEENLPIVSQILSNHTESVG